MVENHPDRDALERFARGQAPDLEESWIERHLRTGCGVCQSAVDQLLPRFEPIPRTSRPAAPPSPRAGGAADGTDWDRVLARLEQRLALIQLEKEAAPRLVAELTRRPPEARSALVRSSRRFQTLAVCEMLIDRSFEESFRDPAAAVQIAQLAITVADQIDVRYYTWSVVQDFRARAWAYLGNALRISSDFAGAWRALAMAEDLAEAGSADPLEEARILDLKASLLCDEGWFEEAAELLDVAIEIYDEIKDQHRKGRALLNKGLCVGYAGQPAEAIELITAGLSLVGWDEEPRLILRARHELIGFLSDSGRCEQARVHLERFRHSYRELSDPWTEVRLAWLEARIAAGLGRFDEAEATLDEVQRRFLEQGRSYDATQVTLDLAILYLQQGKSDEVRQLAERTLPVLLTQDVHRQAIAALVTFQQAAEMDRLTPHLVREIAAYLLRARKNPRLPFRETATA
jgi:tetratricopeptide (TPR) repeat protein